MRRTALMLKCLVAVILLYNNCAFGQPWLPSGCPDKTIQFFRDYGYLPRDPEAKELTIEDLQTALKVFQSFTGLPVTQECDNATVSLMFKQRCGCEDIVKEENEKQKMMAANLIGPLGPQEYRVGNTKWNDQTLTWKITTYPRKNRLPQAGVDACMAKAFKHWSDVTPLRFRQEKDTSRQTHIDIKFVTRRHQTSPPYYDFDGPGNVLAHAFFPRSGVVHFDDDETFVIDSNRGTDLCIVAAHEFGHTLGISHSNIEEALMAPYYRYEQNLRLHPDDVAAVQSIYGRKTNPVPATTLPPRPTARPTARPTTRPVPNPSPEYCDLDIKASFHIPQQRTTYIFTYEKTSAQYYYRAYVYKVYPSGLDPLSKQPLYQLFKSSQRRRAYPSYVNAAAYLPDKQYVFLFSGSRVYRYHVSGSQFILDVATSYNRYPRWMDVTEFPERPQAAVALPYNYGRNYYLLIFGKTMVWDWHFETRPREKVGGWAYPINIFGRNMPMSVDAAVLMNNYHAYFFKGSKMYKFDVSKKRILSTSDIQPIGNFFGRECEM